MKPHLLLTSLLLLSTLLHHAHADLSKRYGHVAPSSVLGSFSKDLTLSNFLKKLPDPATTTITIPSNTRVTIPPASKPNFPHGLVVEGELHFQDGGPDAAEIHLTAAYLLIRGHVVAGTDDAPFQGRLTIELVDGGKDLVVDNLNKFHRFDDLMNFGRKTFVVYGGSVTIVGATSGPLYTHLFRSAVPGNSRVKVEGHVCDHWKAGDVIAIATHRNPHVDYSSMSVVRNCRNTGPASSPRSVVFLKSHLRQTHFVRHVMLTDGSKRDVVLSPEVAKISRNVRIRGMPPSANLDDWLDAGTVLPHGGHIIIGHTAQRFIVHGVEIAAMGQAGIRGRYPLHVHFGDVVHPDSRISWNSVHHSKQRCYVVHATHSLLVKNNVAFRTSGHCFLTEDGIEQNNEFNGNIAIAVRRAIKKISASPRDGQSDDRPAAYWMASPTNDLIDNVAAGTQSLGYWFELFTFMRGQARDMKLPGWRTLRVNTAPFGAFSGNVAHSSSVGVATYPHGSHPSSTALLENLFIWSVGTAWQTNVGSHQHLNNSIFADVWSRGINSHRIEGHTIENLVIVGELFNEGGCTHQVEGIRIEGDLHESKWTSHMKGISFRNVHFQAMTKARNCRRNVGLLVRVDEETDWFATATQIENMSFTQVDEPVRFQYEVDEHRPIAMHVNNMNIPILRGKSGYIINEDFPGQSLFGKDCKGAGEGMEKILFCPKQCFRHVVLAYVELDKYKDTSLRIWNEDRTDSVTLKAEKQNKWNHFVHLTRMVSVIAPAGVYHVEIVDKDGAEVPDHEYNSWTFWLYRPDEREEYPAVCDGHVDFLVHNNVTHEAQ